MNYQESARKFEQLENGFADATTSLTQILTDLGFIKNDISVADAPHAIKYAAAAAIIEDLEVSMKEAAAPENLRVAVQLIKIGEKLRICLPGGAVTSQQEKAWIDHIDNSGVPVPQNLFYIIAQGQLEAKGELNFTYEEELTSASFSSNLAANLRRELREEAGEQSASNIELSEFFPGQRTTTINGIQLPDPEICSRIAEKLADRGVDIRDGNKLSGIFTTVVEKVALAHGNLSRIEALAVDTVEAAGIRVKTLGELLEISLRTAESEEAFRNFRKVHGTEGAYDGIRNPSATWGLQQLAQNLKYKVIASDTYKEGPRGWKKT